MVTQELVDYIKQQTQQGLSKEIIIKTLLVSGETAEDIESGFSAINKIIPAPLPDEQVEVSNLSTRILFDSEIICVLMFLGISGYAASHPLGGMNNLIYSFALFVTILVFVIINIIGLFVFFHKIKKHKSLNQKPPRLLKRLIVLSVLTVVLALVVYIINLLL